MNTSTKTAQHLHDVLTTYANQPDGLEQFVAQNLLEDESPAKYLHDILTYGCISGTVSALVYYGDTQAFYDRYYDEIEDLRHDLQDSLGQPLHINGDIKNHLAWFAFEQTACKIAEQCGLY